MPGNKAQQRENRQVSRQQARAATLREWRNQIQELRKLRQRLTNEFQNDDAARDIEKKIKDLQMQIIKEEIETVTEQETLRK